MWGDEKLTPNRRHRARQSTGISVTWGSTELSLNSVVQPDRITLQARTEGRSSIWDATLRCLHSGFRTGLR